jgi:hypothetical protein
VAVDTLPDDYFINVVVPSRTNSQVDEIEFIDSNSAKTFFWRLGQEKLRLYELIKTGDRWKIIN